MRIFRCDFAEGSTDFAFLTTNALTSSELYLQNVGGKIEDALRSVRTIDINCHGLLMLSSVFQFALGTQA